MIKAIEYASFASEVLVLPAAVTKIQSLLNDETTTMDDFANVVEYYPILASQLLKIVNSPIYNFHGPVHSVTRAVKILGTKAVYDLAISYGVACAFNDICNLPEHYAISLGLNQSSVDKSVDNIRHRLLTVVSLFTTNRYGIN